MLFWIAAVLVWLMFPHKMSTYLLCFRHRLVFNCPDSDVVCLFAHCVMTRLGNFYSSTCRCNWFETLIHAYRWKDIPDVREVTDKTLLQPYATQFFVLRFIMLFASVYLTGQGHLSRLPSLIWRHALSSVEYITQWSKVVWRSPKFSYSNSTR